MSEASRLARPIGDDPGRVEASDTAPATTGDLLRYLYARRVRLLSAFVLLAGVGFAGLLGWWLFGPRSARAVLAIQFRGIERHEYPNGKKFSIEDIRSPGVLARALDDLAVPEPNRDLQRLYRGIDLTPIVPSPVLAR